MTEHIENKGQTGKLRGFPEKNRARASLHSPGDGGRVSRRSSGRGRDETGRETCNSQQAIEDFKNYLKALKRAPGTISGYVGETHRFFQYIAKHGITDVRAVRRADLEAYQTELVDSGHYTICTVHFKMRSVRRFYDYIEHTGKILINPAADLQYPELGDRLPRVVLAASEVKRLLDAPDTSNRKGIRDKAILEILYSTGIRVGELCALTIYDTDLNSGFLRINQGKGCKDRVVPIGHTAKKYLNEYLRHVRGHHTRRKRDERSLFVSINSGGKLGVSDIEALFRKLRTVSAIDKAITPHVMRHTCATHMLAGGADIVYVQRLLGHERISTTQIYARVAQREIKQTHQKCHPSEKEKLPETLPLPRKFMPQETYETRRKHKRD